MDTSDTADSGLSHEQPPEIISAANMAGETGGMSCSTFGTISSFMVFIPLTVILRRIL